ncbi:hypothetical protein BH10PSE19_BH10PSE19_12420 [soil metagenome]
MFGIRKRTRSSASDENESLLIRTPSQKFAATSTPTRMFDSGVSLEKQIDTLKLNFEVFRNMLATESGEFHSQIKEASFLEKTAFKTKCEGLKEVSNNLVKMTNTLKDKYSDSLSMAHRNLIQSIKNTNAEFILYKKAVDEVAIVCPSASTPIAPS